MVERAFDCCVERPEREPVARRERRRRGPVFRRRAMIAGAECDRDKARGITKNHPGGEPRLDRFAARAM